MQSAPLPARTVRQLMQFVLFGWMNSSKWTIEPSVPPADIRRGRSSSQLFWEKKHLPVIKESSRKEGVGLLFSSPSSIFKTNSFIHIFLWLRLCTPETFLTSGQCLGSRGVATPSTFYSDFWHAFDEREVLNSISVLEDFFALSLFCPSPYAAFLSWGALETVSLETSSHESFQKVFWRSYFIPWNH